MPIMILNLALLFVLQLAALQFFFWHRENLSHRFTEFLGRLLLGRGWHVRTIYEIMPRGNLSGVRSSKEFLFGTHLLVGVLYGYGRSGHQVEEPVINLTSRAIKYRTEAPWGLC